MFEDSLMESGGRLKTKSKYWAIGALILNGGHSGHSDPDSADLPRSAAEAGPGHAACGATAATAAAATAPASAVHVVKIQSEMMNNQLTAPSKIPKVIKQMTESAARLRLRAALPAWAATPMARPAASWAAFSAASAPAPPVVKAAAPKKINVSAGVIAGNILAKTRRSIRPSPRRPAFRELWCSRPPSPRRHHRRSSGPQWPAHAATSGSGSSAFLAV